MTVRIYRSLLIAAAFFALAAPAASALEPQRLSAAKRDARFWVREDLTTTRGPHPDARLASYKTAVRRHFLVVRYSIAASDQVSQVRVLFSGRNHEYHVTYDLTRWWCTTACPAGEAPGTVHLEGQGREDRRGRLPL